MPPSESNDANDGSNTNISTSELQSIAANTSSPESQLREAATQAEAALNASKYASSLRTAAAAITDPAKRTKVLQDAYDKEIEAHGRSKKARMLSSGAFQGGVGGGGIGMAVGAGLGTVVGTLVGTVATIPTTAVGVLVGAGVGGVHGPWIKLGMGGKGKDGKGEKAEGKGEDGKSEGKSEENDEHEGEVPDPEILRKAADELEQQRGKEGNGKDASQQKERKKPRKIEVRNKQTATAGA